MTRKMEIKTWCRNPDRVREILQKIKAEYQGTNHQVDSYFQSKTGTLKFREEKNENQLIFNKQVDSEETFLSYTSESSSPLKNILSEAMATISIVKKERESYVLENVYFHLDKVEALGQFLKIKAGNPDGNFPKEKLQEQCNHYIKLLEINAKDLVSESYQNLIKQNSLFSQAFIEED